MAERIAAPPFDAAYEPLTPSEFERFRRLAYDRFGLDLRKGKEHLVAARLGKKIREMNCRSFHDYYERVVADTTGESLVALIDALTTNFTSFFREQAHFDFLRASMLPAIKDRREIRIWSAACSTGEEPYSVMFCILEQLGWTVLPRLHLLATDISSRALETARKGAYPEERFKGASLQPLGGYLVRGQNRWSGWHRVRSEIRERVEFRRMNLIEPFPAIGVFPLIFCRNVMIYFDRPTREALVRRLADVLEPGGHLFVGHAESLAGLDQPLEYVCPAVYRKPDKDPPAGTPQRRTG